MGFIKAFAGAIGGTFADQWKDFYVPSSKVFQQQQHVLSSSIKKYKCMVEEKTIKVIR